MFRSSSRLLPNRSPVAWGSQRIALGALIFHSNAFHFICWAPKFSVFSSEGPFKIFLGSSLDHFKSYTIYLLGYQYSVCVNHNKNNCQYRMFFK